MLVFVRFSGEVCVKSPPVRKKFLNQLARNVKIALGDKLLKLENQYSQFLLKICDSWTQEQASDVLKTVFGIQSFSFVEFQCEVTDKDQLIQQVSEYFQNHHKPSEKTFCVRVKRAGSHSFRSIDVERELGAALMPYFGGVRLADPEQLVELVIRDGLLFLFSKTNSGPLGLPVGVGGKALSMISGGFDSVVASWYILKRGVALDYVFFNLGGHGSLREVLEITQSLVKKWGHGYKPRFIHVDFAAIRKDLEANVPAKFRQVLLKRAFYRHTTLVQAKVSADAVVTGECLGQVSTQTLENLKAIEACTTSVMLRPLIGFDKQDIIALSRRIGSFEACSKVKEFCQISLGKVVTRSSSAHLDELEEALEVKLEELPLEDISLANINPQAIFDRCLLVDSIPEGAKVIDCRTEWEYGDWHFPGSVLRPLEDLESDPKLEPHQLYILYCDVGAVSAVLAEKLQNQGFDTLSFRGGIKALKRFMENEK